MAEDANQYRTEPTGTFLVQQRALVFCARPTLWGFALWGRPTEVDLRRIVPFLELELRDDAVPHASIVDVSRIEVADPRSFAVMTRYLRTNFNAFRTRVTRLALVRPPGVLGATIAGFFQVESPPYPVRVFDALPAACAWMRARDLAPALGAAIAESSGVSPIVQQLRGWLDAHLEKPTVAQAARAVARAPRSMQRDLEAAGTTFQREVDEARVRLAKRLLATSDSAVSEIAYDVGCASPQHFSTLFRRVTGQTPSRWRARART